MINDNENEAENEEQILKIRHKYTKDWIWTQTNILDIKCASLK